MYIAKLLIADLEMFFSKMHSYFVFTLRQTFALIDVFI